MRRRKKAIIVIATVLLALWSLVPIYWFFNLSMMYEAETTVVPPHFIPQMPTYNNYLRILGHGVETPYGHMRPSGYSSAVIRGLKNSFIVAIPGAVITLIVAIPVGYAFGRLRFRHKNKLLLMLLGSRALPPISIALPYFFIYNMMGLLGTTIGLVVIYLSITIPITTWIMMGFFATLPIEIERAARVDGCSRLGALRRVLIPMASPGIAAIGILTFLLCWNEFLFAWVLTSGSPASTLPPVLPSMLFMVTDITALCATLILSIIPPIIIAIAFGRYITRLKLVDPVTVVG